MSQPGQLEGAPQAQGVAQRREHDVGVAQVQREVGEPLRPLDVDAVALRRLDREPDAEPTRQERRPGAGREHDLAGHELSPGGHDAHAGRRRREGERLCPGHHHGARLLGELGCRAREQHRVEVAVLGEEERSRQLATEAREEPAGLRRRHLVGAHAESAGLLDLLRGGRHAGRRLVHLQLAVVVEQPAVAVAGGELVVQARARHVQRAQHGGGRARPFLRTRRSEVPQPARQRRARARRDVEGAGAVEHPLEPLAEHARGGQGRRVTRDEEAAVRVRAALRRADLRLLLEQGDGGPRPRQLERAARADGSAADDDDVFALLQGTPAPCA